MSYNILKQISDDIQSLIFNHWYSITDIQSLIFIRQTIVCNLEPPKRKVVIVRGSRGTGKTTAILQFLVAKQNEAHKVIYLSADSVYLKGLST